MFRSNNDSILLLNNSLHIAIRWLLLQNNVARSITLGWTMSFKDYHVDLFLCSDQRRWREWQCLILMIFYGRVVDSNWGVEECRGGVQERMFEWWRWKCSSNEWGNVRVVYEGIIEICWMECSRGVGAHLRYNFIGGTVGWLGGKRESNISEMEWQKSVLVKEWSRKNADRMNELSGFGDWM